jgi:hypothetical protein
MFIVKLVKFKGHSDNAPSEFETTSIREANAIHIKHEDQHKILQLGDAPGETMEVTLGSLSDCSYEVAYVMNSQGKTIETIR